MAARAMEPQMGLTFEQVWAALMELRESGAETERLLKENSAETARLLKENSAETERLLKENSTETARLSKEQSADFDRRLQETDREIKALARNIGGLNNSLGKLIEQMFSAQLWDKFAALGYDFTKGSNAKFREDKRVIAEVDIFLENGEYAMPVEVKTHLQEEDVDEHRERIEKIRGYMDRRGDARRLVGAVAGGTVPDRVRRYAQEQGLYVVEQSGESVSIAEAPAGFTARVW